MTEVDFHFNVADRLVYTCRLLRKATRQRAGVAVTGPAEVLDALDQLLWTFEDTEFVPHLRLATGAPVPPRLQDTPIWLVDTASQALHLPVLLNLGAEPAAGFEHCARLIEVVGSDPAEREAARRRWRHYAGLGHAIKAHEAAA